MTRIRLASATAFAILLLGCGGEDKRAAGERELQRVEDQIAAVEGADVPTDVLLAAGDILDYCKNPAASLPSEAGEAVDEMLKAAPAPNPKTAEVMRDSANTLRDCGQPELADRLNRATD